jgi:hypothetical protein
MPDTFQFEVLTLMTPSSNYRTEKVPAVVGVGDASELIKVRQQNLRDLNQWVCGIGPFT